MTPEGESYAGWNPWHGCTKLSPGCLHCYVYRQDEMYGTMTASSLCRKNDEFDLPVRRGRGGQYRIPPGKIVYTCFTSDFLLKDADEWRGECWRMMRERSDCLFYFFTKRIDRFESVMPADWGDGYENVIIGCTVENRDRADFRLPIFRSLPIRHKAIICEPLLTDLDIGAYLDDSIEEVCVGGESGRDARPCNYDWILNIRAQCVEKEVPFVFHQTGANFIKDGRVYRIPRREQHAQAKRANINYLHHSYSVPVPEPEPTLFDLD